MNKKAQEPTKSWAAFVHTTGCTFCDTIYNDRSPASVCPGCGRVYKAFWEPEGEKTPGHVTAHAELLGHFLAERLREEMDQWAIPPKVRAFIDAVQSRPCGPRVPHCRCGGRGFTLVPESSQVISCYRCTRQSIKISEFDLAMHVNQ